MTQRLWGCFRTWTSMHSPPLGPSVFAHHSTVIKVQSANPRRMFFFTPWCHCLMLPRALCIAGKCHDNCYKRISCKVDLVRLHTGLTAHNNDSQWHLSNQEGKHGRKGTTSATRKQQLYVSPFSSYRQVIFGGCCQAARIKAVSSDDWAGCGSLLWCEQLGSSWVSWFALWCECRVGSVVCYMYTH